MHIDLVINSFVVFQSLLIRQPALYRLLIAYSASLTKYRLL